MVIGALTRAARKFFERSLTWRQDRYIGYGKGLVKAKIAPEDPAAQSLVSVIRAQVKGQNKPLGPAPNGFNDAETSEGQPKFYSSDAVGYLQLQPMPTESTVVLVKIAIKPAIGSQVIPDGLGEMYGEIIAEGAVAEILSIPDSKQYNPKQSDFHRNNFNRGITTALNKVEMGYSNTGGRVYGGQFI